MPLDIFQPSEEPSNPQSAASEWSQVLQDPKVRASMLSIGLQLMQPPSFGQTTSGQFAQAIGQGGETLTRIDEQERAEAEQERKRADTESQIQYRADTSDVKAGQLQVQQLRTEQAGRDLESKAALRDIQGQVQLARIGQIQAQIEALEMKTRLAPGDTAAKIALAQKKSELIAAQAGLVAARTEAVAPVAASVVRRNDAAANLSERRAGAVDTTNELARLRLEQGNRRLTTQERIAMQRLEQQEMRDYTTEKTKAQEVHRKEQAMLPRARQTPFMFPSREEWSKSRRPAEPGTPAPTGGATAPTTTPTPSPAAPVNVATETEQAKRAIATAKNPETKAAIRQLFKQRTGMDLPE